MKLHGRSDVFLPPPAFVRPAERRALLISVSWSFRRCSPPAAFVRPTERRALLISVSWSFRRSPPLENFYLPGLGRPFGRSIRFFAYFCRDDKNFLAEANRLC